VPTARSKILGPFAATLALYAGLMALYVVKHGGDPATLLCVGGNHAGHAPYEAVRTSIGPTGYDGQFYYAIARAPWQLQSGDSIDAPAARHLRVLYPLLCWLCSGGHARLLFIMMPAVNLAALGALAGLGAWVALRFGRSPWWGFFLPFALNAGLPALHNLTDPLSMLCLFGLLSGWLLGTPGWALALWAAGAVFSREQNLAVVGVLAVAACWNGRLRAAVGLGFVVAAWACWVCWLRYAYGTWPFLQGQGNFGVPLAGVLYRVTHPGGNLGFSTRLAIIFGLSLAHLVGQVGLAFYVWHKKIDGAVAACMFGGVLLAVVADTYIFGDFWSYTRVFVWLPLGIWLGSFQAGLRWPLVALTPAFLWALVGALRYV
jgi:hypothetical protein